ncbi:MAG: methionyl-tRNA formyltransferase, partial [Pseudomonadota bacterium]|nr:methionyl-tRNA formyltransferase [Pseudomonadota bacterium]
MIKKVSNCLNIVFMGTPAFSIPTLNTLIESPHNLKCVYTQPAKPSGRGLRKQFSHIHKFSNDRGINIRTPKIISDDNEFIFLQACDLDIIIVVAYGLILPSEILLLPKYGCLNIHASILPRWRGAAPIQRAI